MRTNDTQAGSDRLRPRRALYVSVLSLLMLPALAQAAFFERLPDGMIKPFRAKEMPLAEFAREYGRFTGKEIASAGILDEAVKGRVTMLLRRPLTEAALLELFHVALESNGYAALESANGRGWTLHRQRDARDLTLPLFDTGRDGRDKLARDHRLVTVTHTLKHPVAEEAARASRSYMPAASRIIPMGGHKLMITDSARNIHKVLAIVDLMDTQETAREARARSEQPRCEPREIKIERLTVDRLEVANAPTGNPPPPSAAPQKVGGGK